MKKLILLSTTFVCLAFTVSAQFSEIDTRLEVEEVTQVQPDLADAVFRTQTIGGWGSKPRMDREGNITGNNPGSYLHANWDALFPDGITIGSGEITLTFTNAQAITDFLPSGGNRALEESMVDPMGREVKNTLASQVLAATISVRVGDLMPEYLKLATAETADGITVQQALSTANKVLAGETVEGYSADAINEIITQINESNVDAEVQTEYVTQRF